MVLVLNPELIIFPLTRIRAGTFGISKDLDISRVVGKVKFGGVILEKHHRLKIKDYLVVKKMIFVQKKSATPKTFS